MTITRDESDRRLTEAHLAHEARLQEIKAEMFARIADAERQYAQALVAIALEWGKA